MDIADRISFNPVKILLALFSLLALYLTSLYSYLLFHSLIELLSILLAGSIFFLAWNFRRFYKDSFLIFIGTAYIFCSAIDLLHTLAYKGMGIFSGFGANLPTQLWIAARYLQGISLLASAFFLNRKVHIGWLITGFTLVTSLLLLSIFVWGIFPISYIDGVGLTPFKIYSEYVIDLFLVAAVIVLLRSRRNLDRKVLQWMAYSISLTIVSELAFTFYIDVYALSNLIGHFFRLGAFFLVYKASIETEAGHIYTDMTQLRETQGALRASEDRAQRSLAELRSIYANTPVGLCFIDTSLCFQAINDMLAEINGLPAPDHIGKPLYEVLPPNFAQAIEQVVRQTMETGQPVLNQEMGGIVDADSDQMGHWQVSYHPVFGKDHVLLGVSCVVQDVTEQRRAEDALRASDQNFRLFIEYAPASIAMFDNQMRYIAASRRYLIDYRVKEKDIIGRSHYEIFPDIPERWKEIHRRCLAGAIEKQDEDQFPREDGSLDWVRWEIHPWHNDHGEIGGIILFSEVITDGVQAKQKLNESEERFRTLIDEAPIAIALSRESRFLYVNPAYLQMHGLATADELIGHPIYERVAPESMLQSKERASRRRQGLTVDKSYEYLALRKDGSQTPTLAAVTRVSLADGPATVGFFQDITGRKLAEDRIRRQNATLSGINRIFQGAMSCQTEEELSQLCLTIVKEVTQSTMGFLGEINHQTGLLDDIAICCAGWNDTRTPESGQTWQKAPMSFEIQGVCGRVIQDGKGFFTNDPLEHPDSNGVPAGHPLLMTFLGVPLIHGEKIIGMVGLANRDGGYRQEELEAAQALMPAVVQVIMNKRAERDLALAHDSLRVYAEKLADSNLELEQFAFVASHDLQEPLRKIKMFGNLLHRQIDSSTSGEKSSDVQDSIHRMQNAAERMQEMIDGLLELSRINIRGASFEPTNLNRIVEDAISNLEARIQVTGGQVIFGELYSADVDAAQMRRLFQNLIGNALKFHKPDVAPVIEIAGTIARVPEALITISVKDNGIGFDEQYAQRIFQPFQRLHGRGEYEGTGLGLSICQKIVERHHGKIEAHSRPGEGALFLITLPIHQRAA